MSNGLWRIVLLVAVLVAVSGQTKPPSATQVKPPNYFVMIPPGTQVVDLLPYTKRDPRIEAVARAICRLKGIDPDHEGPPFPRGPIWELFIPQAMLFIAEDDAVDAAAKPR
jgi:hypothetical protein